MTHNNRKTQDYEPYNKFISKNRFEPLDDHKSDFEQQVFHKDLPKADFTLADIMKELMSIKARQDLQEKRQDSTRSENLDWRHPRSQRRSTQEQERDWDSQRRNISQRRQF